MHQFISIHWPMCNLLAVIYDDNITNTERFIYYQSLLDWKYFTDKTIEYQCFLVVFCVLLAILSNDWIVIFVCLYHLLVEFISGQPSYFDEIVAGITLCIAWVVPQLERPHIKCIVEFIRIDRVFFVNLAGISLSIYKHSTIYTTNCHSQTRSTWNTWGFDCRSSIRRDGHWESESVRPDQGYGKNIKGEKASENCGLVYSVRMFFLENCGILECLWDVDPRDPAQDLPKIIQIQNTVQRHSLVSCSIILIIQVSFQVLIYVFNLTSTKTPSQDSTMNMNTWHRQAQTCTASKPNNGRHSYKAK